MDCVFKKAELFKTVEVLKTRRENVVYVLLEERALRNASQVGYTHSTVTLIF